MAKVICIHCKHDLDEHELDKETNLKLCTRVMEIKAGRVYRVCRCSYLNSKKREMRVAYVQGRILMANLDDLGVKSITDMTTDEALELIRQARLRRRTPIKTVKTTTKKPPKTFDTSQLSEEDKAELLKLLMGD